MSNSEENTLYEIILLVIGIIVILLLIEVAKLANFLDAGFWSVFNAVILTLIIVALAIALIFFIGEKILKNNTIIFGSLVIIWPGWWPVIKSHIKKANPYGISGYTTYQPFGISSTAIPGQNYNPSVPWWAWGIEIVLIAFFVYTFRSFLRDLF